MLTSPISTGGMGEIWWALLTKKDLPIARKPVALKVIVSHRSQADEVRKRFEDEMTISAMLQHPNVVSITDFGVEERLDPDNRTVHEWFIAMEGFIGVNLAELLAAWRAKMAEQPFPHKLAAYVVAKVCAGLDYAHRLEAGGHHLRLVHRDLKPANVIVSSEGEVKIIDFGIARFAERQSQTNAGSVIGTPAYMSPEQVVGRPLDHRSDIFAAGVVLYELCTGARPFKRDNELATKFAIRDCEVRPPREIDPDFPRELEVVVLRALAKRREKRYPDAKEMCEALLGYAGRDVSERELSRIVNEVCASTLKSRRKQRDETSETTVRERPTEETPRMTEVRELADLSPTPVANQTPSFSTDSDVTDPCAPPAVNEQAQADELAAEKSKTIRSAIERARVEPPRLVPPFPVRRRRVTKAYVILWGLALILPLVIVLGRTSHPADAGQKLASKLINHGGLKRHAVTTMTTLATQGPTQPPKAQPHDSQVRIELATEAGAASERYSELDDERLAALELAPGRYEFRVIWKSGSFAQTELEIGTDEALDMTSIKAALANKVYDQAQLISMAPGPKGRDKALEILRVCVELAALPKCQSMLEVLRAQDTASE